MDYRLRVPPFLLQAPADSGPEEAAPLAAVPSGAAPAAVGAEWLEKHGWMVAYMRAHGGALPRISHRIPEGAPGGGFALGTWVAYQRRGRGVTDARRAALDATEGWSWARPRAELDPQWDAMLAKAALYFFEKGIWPPSRYKDPADGVHVGNWVCEQRQLYKGRASRWPLSPDRVAKLEATPGWLWAVQGCHATCAREAHWDAMLVRAIRYFVGKGVWPPSSYRDPADGSPVGRWVYQQRRLHRNLGDKGLLLPPARFAKLEASPGWLWDAKAGPTAEQEAHWDAMLAKAAHYWPQLVLAPATTDGPPRAP